ncbi:hypothetical protein DP49_7052 [Burkholderia pseudomallei]|nr:hypothetical protein DP49_7052 [Burkholderia pseudomallei]
MLLAIATCAPLTVVVPAPASVLAKVPADASPSSRPVLVSWAVVLTFTVPEPTPPASVSLNSPSEIVVVPVAPALACAMVSVPVPFLVKSPVPPSILVRVQSVAVSILKVPALLIAAVPKLLAAEAVRRVPAAVFQRPDSVLLPNSVTSALLVRLTAPAPPMALASVPVAPLSASVPLSVIAPLPKPATLFRLMVAPRLMAVLVVRLVLAPCMSSVPPFTFNWPAPVSVPAELPPLLTFSVPPCTSSVEPAAPASEPTVWVFPFRSNPAVLAKLSLLV